MVNLDTLNGPKHFRYFSCFCFYDGKISFFLFYKLCVTDLLDLNLQWANEASKKKEEWIYIKRFSEIKNV